MLCQGKSGYVRLAQINCGNVWLREVMPSYINLCQVSTV